MALLPTDQSNANLRNHGPHLHSLGFAFAFVFAFLFCHPYVRQVHRQWAAKLNG
jgi:hypothetical protein